MLLANFYLWRKKVRLSRNKMYPIRFCQNGKGNWRKLGRLGMGLAPLNPANKILIKETLSLHNNINQYYGG